MFYLGNCVEETKWLSGLDSWTKQPFWRQGRAALSPFCKIPAWVDSKARVSQTLSLSRHYIVGSTWWIPTRAAWVGAPTLASFRKMRWYRSSQVCHWKKSSLSKESMAEWDTEDMICRDPNLVKCGDRWTVWHKSSPSSGRRIAWCVRACCQSSNLEQCLPMNGRYFFPAVWQAFSPYRGWLALAGAPGLYSTSSSANSMWSGQLCSGFPTMATLLSDTDRAGSFEEEKMVLLSLVAYQVLSRWNSSSLQGWTSE